MFFIIKVLSNSSQFAQASEEFVNKCIIFIAFIQIDIKISLLKIWLLIPPLVRLMSHSAFKKASADIALGNTYTTHLALRSSGRCYVFTPFSSLLLPWVVQQGRLRKRVCVTKGWHARMFAKRIKKREASGHGEKKKECLWDGSVDRGDTEGERRKESVKEPEGYNCTECPFAFQRSRCDSFFYTARLPVVLFVFPLMFAPIFAPLIAAFSFNLDFLSLSGRFYSRNGN